MLSYSSRPPDPSLVGENWRKMWMNRLENLELDLSRWLNHQHRDEYWKYGSVCEDYSAIKAAVLSISGWHDGYRNTTNHLIKNLTSPVKGIIGPWIHKYPHYAAPSPAIGFLQEAKRWWDHWLKDIDTGVDKDPDFRAYLMDSVTPKRWMDDRPGRWIVEKNWPSQTINKEILYFSQGAALELSPTPFNVSISSAQNCGSKAGEYFPFAFSDELPENQSHDDAHSACFDGDELTAPIDIVGSPHVNLRLCCDKDQGQVIVRLCDIRPDGTSALITYQYLNLTHHNSHENPSKISKNQMLNVSLDLDQIAYRIPDGHRLRVAISSSYWPTLWPSPERTTLNIESGSIELPIRPFANGAEMSFEEPEAAKPWGAKELRPASYTREEFIDEKTGITSIKIGCDFGENQDLDHGLISGGWMKENWAIHPDDPNSAKVDARWENTGGRAGTMWRTNVKSAMHSDKTHFFITANLKAYENDKLIFEKDYSDKIIRNLV
jgi:predicted acyl esterase